MFTVTQGQPMVPYRLDFVVDRTSVILTVLYQQRLRQLYIEIHEPLQHYIDPWVGRPFLYNTAQMFFIQYL